MIHPALQDEAFLADVAGVRDARSDALHLWWLGQSGFLLQWRGRHLLFDPYLSDSLTEKYAQTPKPHVRMTERVVAPHRLDFVEVALSSHNHTDHLDAQTLIPLDGACPDLKIVVSSANVEFAADRLRVEPRRLRGIDVGETADVAGFKIKAVPAAHETIELDAAGRHRCVGYIVRAGAWTVYHSGDTIVYPGMAEFVGRVDVAILPINGKVGNMNGADAAWLAKQISAALAIPCHYEMFEFNTASPELFARECERLALPCRIPRAGERVTLAKDDRS